MKKRLEFIDIAKGIGILFVLLNHVESYQWVTFSSFFVIPADKGFCADYFFCIEEEFWLVVNDKFVFLKRPFHVKNYIFFKLAVNFHLGSKNADSLWIQA